MCFLSNLPATIRAETFLSLKRVGLVGQHYFPALQEVFFVSLSQVYQHLNAWFIASVIDPFKVFLVLSVNEGF